MDRKKKNEVQMCEVDGCSLIACLICLDCGTKVCLRHDTREVRIITDQLRLRNVLDTTGVSGHPCAIWRTEVFPLPLTTVQPVTDAKNAETKRRK